MRRSILVAAAALVAAAPVGAQEVRVGGEIRPRLEARREEGTDRAFTSMRTRLDVAAPLGPARAFVQMQDVRVWGEETSTLGDYSADRLDLHQAYIALGAPDAEGAMARVGRQEIEWGDERLIGSVGWAQQGRSLDGARAGWRRAALGVEAFAAQLADEDAPGGSGNAGIGGVRAAFARPGARLAAFAIVDGDDGAPDLRRTTTGVDAFAARGPFSASAEAAIQRGRLGGADVVADMVGFRAALAVRGWTFGALYDRLSGDDDPADGTARTFSTLLATNHKFYGLADLFTDLPAHTGGRGLQDLGASVETRVGPVTVGVTAHSFRAAATPAGAEPHFGDELDLLARAPLAERLGLTAGWSGVRVDDGLREVGRADADFGVAYLMLDARF